ncbi:MAG TPA: hypothetical protein VD838_08150, partial [Anaeromyxobacteraceae bacterium]|nr:hypothetical protein [Anaeromyxobacteraceae bacterium]
MTWILWTELGPRCRGPLAFAAWLADRVGVRFADLVVPVHVLTAEHLRAALRTRHLADLVDAERSAIAGTLAETVGPEAGALDVVQATTADEGLEEARERHGATGVIVARAAACEGRHVVRLGAVARRLVHRLASPVIVVPPDLTASSIGDGPVVAASSLGDDAVPACRLARVVADATGRDLTILHVDEDEQPALAG